MSRRKSSPSRKGGGRKSQVTKFPPEAPAARDEGPRLIPLPDVDSPLSRNAAESGLPTNRYVALADHAMRLWSSERPAPDHESKKTEPPQPRRQKR